MRFRGLAAATGTCCVLAGWVVWATQGASTATTAAPSLVRLKVLVQQDVPMTLAVRNGEMARITIQNGAEFGLTPNVTSQGVRLYVFEITPGTTAGAERLQQVAKLPLSLDHPTGIPADHSLFEFTMLGVEPLAMSLAPPTRPEDPDAPCVRCCVTCDGITGCACAVVMDCGSCCCKDHCSCPGDGTTTTGCSAPVGAGHESRVPRSRETGRR